jgi:endonuclease/exonuclease/phosphatase (EEP) superfamily protein YafD
MNDADLRSDQFNLKNVFATMLRGALGLGALSFMIVTLIGLYGAVDAEYDTVNHFRIWITLPALLLALLALVVKARAAAAMTLAALLVHAFAIVPEVYARWTLPHAGGAADRLKVVTLNMRFNFADAAGIRRFVQTEQPDILVMQEAWGKSAMAIDGLKDLLPFRADCVNRHLCNLALLSRLPIRATEIGPASGAGPAAAIPRMLSAEIDLGAIGRPDETAMIITTHLSWPLPPRLQASQFRQLARKIAGFDPESVIVAGDFNSTPWSHAMRRYDSATPLRRVTRAVHTWPARRRIAGYVLPFPLLPIDHVFAGSKFSADSVRRGPFLGSDHYPVIVEFAVAD